MNIGSNGSPVTVIVAENYPISRAALAALLSHDGYRVFQAANAKSAISHLDTVPDVGVLLADLDMAQWRSIVRHATETTDAFVIAMEGSMPFSEMYDLKELGIQLCLQKPLIYGDVLAALEENIHLSGDEAPYRKAA